MSDGDGQRRGELPWLGGMAILAAAVVAFLVEQRSIAAVNGWWFDELYSVWGTDPKLGFLQAYGYRFRWDPSPPLYYSALYWVRRFVTAHAGQERIWNYVLSALALVLASAVVVRVSRRAGLTGFALAGVGAFLVSGPVVEYVPEVRGYLMAMAIVFVAAWFAALTVEAPAVRIPWLGWVAVGLLAGLTHLYAALMCGTLAAGLLVVAFFGGRRDLKVDGLMLGLSASSAYAVWSIATAAPKVWLTYHWIVFSRGETAYAVKENLYLEAGGYIAFALLIAILVIALVFRSTRPLTLAFCTAFAMFYLLPILVSFKAPIVYDRYWMIGGPALVVLLLFLARAGLREAIPSRLRAMPLALGTGAVLFLFASSATGFTYARFRTEHKKKWAWTGFVAPLARDCPIGSIRVLGNVTGYAQLSELPAALFVGSDAPASTVPIDPTCPVLGWGEDIYVYHLNSPTYEDLLRLLKLEASPTEVELRRQSYGFVVLRRSGGVPSRK